MKYSIVFVAALMSMGMETSIYAMKKRSPYVLSSHREETRETHSLKKNHLSSRSFEESFQEEEKEEPEDHHGGKKAMVGVFCEKPKKSKDIKENEEEEVLVKENALEVYKKKFPEPQERGGG